MTARATGLFACTLTHERMERVRHRFSYPLQLWLVDLDDVPRPWWPLRALVSFRAADHLGDPRQSIRTNVERFAGLNGFDLQGGKILMLAQARALGYVFDPVSVFWCHGGDGALRCLIAEVRNTYGERHCYLLQPDAAGRATADKALYVSPMFPVDGRYLMRFTLGQDSVALSMVLRRPDGPRTSSMHTALTATLRGRRVPPGLPTALAVARRPLAAYRTAALIYLESRRLRRKGLPLLRRRTHDPQSGVESIEVEGPWSLNGG